MLGHVKTAQCWDLICLFSALHDHVRVILFRSSVINTCFRFYWMKFGAINSVAVQCDINEMFVYLLSFYPQIIDGTHCSQRHATRGIMVIVCLVAILRPEKKSDVIMQCLTIPMSDASLFFLGTVPSVSLTWRRLARTSRILKGFLFSCPWVLSCAQFFPAA
jgi:hypothetical protein